MTILRLLASLLLLLIAGLCFFGFLATFEPPGSLALGIVYGGIGAACIAAAGVFITRRPRPNSRP